MKRCDALVIGGGPAGATAALLLARAGRRVVIVEKSVFPRRKVCGEFISATTWPVLEQIGLAGELLAMAGPPVRRVGVFTGPLQITAALPEIRARLESKRARLELFGRALGREHLDSALLHHAAIAGAEIRQPWSLIRYEPLDDRVRCVIAEAHGERTEALDATLVIAAHGAWESGVLPTQQLPHVSRNGDLLGFKAHFNGSALPPDLMPLIAFPGGYGGMVHSDAGRVSLSCCVRHDALRAMRARHRRLAAGPALFAEILDHCAGVADALGGAGQQGPWLAAGPMRTGIRTFGSGRIIAIGNAAAEAHPIVAEGISMAIQSAQLLCAELTSSDEAMTIARVAAVRRVYARAWMHNFSRRLHAAAVFAHVFMRPATAMIAARSLQLLPRLLTLGAQFSGKDSLLRGTHTEHTLSESSR